MTEPYCINPTGVIMLMMLFAVIFFVGFSFGIASAQHKRPRIK